MTCPENHRCIHVHPAPAGSPYTFVLTHRAWTALDTTGHMPHRGLYVFYDEQVGEGEASGCGAGTTQKLAGLLLHAEMRGIMVVRAEDRFEQLPNFQRLHRPSREELARLFEEPDIAPALHTHVQSENSGD